MSVTALDVITQAVRKLNVYAPGETLSDADAEQGLTSLNDMLDSWSNESLSCYAIIEQSGTIQAGVTQYTIGPGGAFNTTRPLRLISGPGAAYLLDSNGDKYMMDVVERDQFNLISQPNTNSDLPTTIFYDPQFPLGVINVYPAPYQAFPIYFDSYLQLSQLPALSTAISLPPGYKTAIQDNLALQLWPFFKPEGSQPTANLMRDAAISKGNVKRTNIRLSFSGYSPVIVARPTGGWNIYTNDWNR